MKHLIVLILLLPAFVVAQSIDQYQNQSGSGKGSNGSVGQKQNQKQQQEQAQIQSTVASSEQAQDNVQQTTFEGGAPDIVMVPNNNTAGCQRVYGIMFSSSSGGGGLGYPYRDKDCDFEQAADDASATGQHTIAWYWRCHKKALYKQFNGSKEQRIEACHQRMLGMYVQEKPYREVIIPEPIPQTIVNCDVGQHDAKHNRIFEACQVGK